MAVDNCGATYNIRAEINKAKQKLLVMQTDGVSVSCRGLRTAKECWHRFIPHFIKISGMKNAYNDYKS